MDPKDRPREEAVFFVAYGAPKPATIPREEHCMPTPEESPMPPSEQLSVDYGSPAVESLQSVQAQLESYAEELGFEQTLNRILVRRHGNIHSDPAIEEAERVEMMLDDIIKRMIAQYPPQERYERGKRLINFLINNYIQGSFPTSSGATVPQTDEWEQR